MCRSTNRQQEPEVWFRIIYIEQENPDDSPVAGYREQTVEIALGPDGAFASSKIASLTRRVPANVLAGAMPRRNIPKPPEEPRTLRVVELLRKAIEWKAQLESGQIANQAEVAHREGITRARVTQVMSMLRLAPGIQDAILSMPNNARRKPVTERWARRIAVIGDHSVQLREYYSFVAKH